MMKAEQEQKNGGGEESVEKGLGIKMRLRDGDVDIQK